MTPFSCRGPAHACTQPASHIPPRRRSMATDSMRRVRRHRPTLTHATNRVISATRPLHPVGMRRPSICDRHRHPDVIADAPARAPFCISCAHSPTPLLTEAIALQSAGMSTPYPLPSGLPQHQGARLSCPGPLPPATRAPHDPPLIATHRLRAIRAPQSASARWSLGRLLLLAPPSSGQ